jgi:hypothetical protein
MARPREETPVSISSGCARAVLDDRKTMLRQVAVDADALCPLGGPGDRLWVREPWASAGGAIAYAADAGVGPVARAASAPVWQPSRTMPREASRILVEIEATRLERLQAIPPEDLAPEGSLWLPAAAAGETPRQGFARWWDSLHPRPGAQWGDDPWVWVVRFRRVVP